MVCEAENSYTLALYRKRVLIPTINVELKKGVNINNP